MMMLKIQGHVMLKTPALHEGICMMSTEVWCLDGARWLPEQELVGKGISPLWEICFH